MNGIEKYIDYVLEVRGMALVQSARKKTLKKLLTLVSKGNKQLYTVEMFRETDSSTTLWIPRQLVKSYQILPDLPEHRVSFNTNIKLRPEQQMIVNQWLDSYYPYGGIIQAQTGSGKTVMAIWLMHHIGYKPLIIVPTDRLMSQWKERLLQFTDLKSEDIGIIRQNICQYDRKVVIGMLHSLAMKEDYPSEMYGAFSLLCVDEVHKLHAEVFSRIVKKFNTRIALGLSATPRSKTGMEKVFLWGIGDVVAKSDLQVAKPKIRIIKYKGVDVHHVGCVFNGELSLGKYLNKLARSSKRTKLIASAIRVLYKEGHHILVLSDRLKILKDLKTILTEEDIPSKDVGLFTGQVKQLDRRILLGTYGSAGLGADIPRLTALIFATPRTDIVQPLGRVTRIKGATPVVIDVIDSASNIMTKWANARLREYRKYTSDIKVVL